ncbi:histidinol-phosphate transaminase [Blattabacterium cuenoti]|uniref:histidinol-phosphate transaminase n=1 Tax=Blattabacterium cuenoti TaxID=1653831 RepID=UPI00163BCB4C|nr:histidinol-phosphate transaminase [Blattabacterium cuenoti]
MLKFNLLSLIRKNIVKLNPYSSARIEYNNYDNKKNKDIITFLDANENSFGSTLCEKNFYNRYPDPFQRKLKNKISKIKKISTSNIFLGNGSDEIIDLVYRIFSYPNIDNSIIFPPTYGMYEIMGKIHGVDVRSIPLNKEDYQINLNKLENIIDKYSKIIFICSPNNPTGNDIKEEYIINIINRFSGIVILDEAYIDFSNKESFSKKIEKYPNLVILQTLSKSWGLAGIRIGIGIASKEIINWMNKIKNPYNISETSQKIALNALENKNLFLCNLKNILIERNYVINEFKKISYINKIYPSSANFILIKVKNYSKKLYNYLVKKKIIVRDRSKIILCNHCLRITIGTKKENKFLIKNIKNFFKKMYR